MSTWISGKIIFVKNWTQQLFSLIVHASIDKFSAGQFTRIKARCHNNMVIQRAYSYLNAPSNPNLEFYIVTVSQGKLTSLLSALTVGESIMLTKEAYGRFILEEIPSCKDLWMFGTGTGISPYLSILESNDTRLENFSNIVLVHAVKFFENLNYLYKMMDLKKLYRGKLHIQIVLSQEKVSGFLYGRIPQLIENNMLEKAVGFNLDPCHSHVMLCGNPQMIIDTKTVLKKKYGMKDFYAQNKSGNITYERYW